MGICSVVFHSVKARQSRLGYPTCRWVNANCRVMPISLVPNEGFEVFHSHPNRSLTTARHIGSSERRRLALPSLPRSSVLQDRVHQAARTCNRYIDPAQAWAIYFVPPSVFSPRPPLLIYPRNGRVNDREDAVGMANRHGPHQPFISGRQKRG